MELVIKLVPLSGAARANSRNALAQAGLTHADVMEVGRTFFAGQCRGRTVGYIGLEVYGGDALLRSLLVIEAEQGHKGLDALWFRLVSPPPPLRAPLTFGH